MEQTNQTFNALAVIPFTLVLYDYPITLDKEVEYIWTKPMSSVTLIYIMLRYFGTTTMLFFTIVLLTNRDTPNSSQANNHIFPALQTWPILVEIWLVHIVLQMRLYVLYNRSKKVLFIVVLGFIIEVTSGLVTQINVTIFEVNNVFNPAVSFVDSPLTETIDIYVSYGVILLYEFLLFSFALWACIQCSRHPFAINRIGVRSLRVVLIQGNVMYFLVILLYMLASVILTFIIPARQFYVAPYFGVALLTIIGSEIILHIRSAAWKSSTDSVDIPNVIQDLKTTLSSSSMILSDP